MLICLNSRFLLLPALSCRGQLGTGASALQLSARRSRNTNTAHARGPGAAPRTQLGGRLSVSQAHPVHLRCPHLSWLSRFTQREMIYRCYGSKSAARAPRGWWSISSTLAGDAKDKHRMEKKHYNYYYYFFVNEVLTAATQIEFQTCDYFSFSAC